MDKQKLLEMGLTEEQADKVLEANKIQLEGFIPKNRFDDVNKDKKKLEADIVERDKQLENFLEQDDIIIDLIKIHIQFMPANTT